MHYLGSLALVVVSLGKGRTSRVYCQAPMYYSNTLIGLFSDGELVFVTAFTVRYELSSDTSANEQPC